MITRDYLSEYLEKFLSCDKFKDYAPNGLQVEGRQEIHHVCTAVSASEDAIIKALENNADALIVHHGFFWKGDEPNIVGIMRKRLKLLLENNLNLYAYHLPLDSHLEIGNNACIAKLLDVKDIKYCAIDNIPNIPWSGTLKNSYNLDDFTNLLSIKFQKPIVVEANSNKIRNIAWCTGAAQDFIVKASGLGVDAYISGEISERTYTQAKELGINYFACGHNATERFGIQALANHLALKTNISHNFIDIFNPI